MMSIQLLISVSLPLLLTVNCRLINFEDEGGHPDDFANEVAWLNGNLLNTTLASLTPGGLRNK